MKQMEAQAIFDTILSTIKLYPDQDVLVMEYSPDPHPEETSRAFGPTAVFGFSVVLMSPTGMYSGRAQDLINIEEQTDADLHFGINSFGMHTATFE